VGDIFDLGNPAARTWLIDHLDRMIKTEGIDWYREDMNGGGPLPAWRNHDGPDRQGITENLYVQGHLQLWDELRRRNPGLRIDSCASGGRRNDLETMRRDGPPPVS
jgi:alpha-galactosidase